MDWGLDLDYGSLSFWLKGPRAANEQRLLTIMDFDIFRAIMSFVMAVVVVVVVVLYEAGLDDP